MTLAIQWSTETVNETGGAFVSSFSEHSLRFDAVTKEVHDMTSVVTEHAVEGAAAISDHKRPDPRRLSLEVTVTNTPTGDVLPSGYEDFRPPTTVEGSAGGVAVLQYSSTFDRVSDVFQTLKRLVSEPTLLTVIAETGLEVYENMTIVNVSAPRESGDGASITFSIDFIEVRLAEARLVDAPEPREVRGSRAQNSGTQETEDAEESEQVNQSILSDYNERVESGQSRREAMAGALGFGE